MKKRNRLMLLGIRLLTGKLFSGRKMNIGEMTSDALKKAALGIAGGFIVMTVFSVGLVMTLVDLFVSYRENQQLAFTSFSLISGLMVLIPLIGLGVWGIDVFTTSRQHKRETYSPRKSSPQLDNLTAAVTALVQDFITERQFRRDQEIAATYAAAANRSAAEGSVYNEIFEDEIPPHDYKQAI